MGEKAVTTIRLSARSRDVIRRYVDLLGVSQNDVIEIAIRQLDAFGIRIDPEPANDHDRADDRPAQ